MRMLAIMLWLGVVANGLAMAGETPRWSSPVVLTGSQIPKLKGAPPETLVAFRFTTQWEQIPVQVDERAVVDFLKIYGPTAQSATYKPKSFSTLVYTDPNTLTGADSDTTLDNDDEVVFMLRDSGAKAPASIVDPVGVVAGSGLEVVITDPVNGAASTYAYLYRSAGALAPDAGKSYVIYSFRLTSGDYKTTYKFAAGPNPETSTITTPYYKQGFTDRWITNSLALLPPHGTGVDILDMQKFEFAPGISARTVNTFCAGEGAFIVNKSGPVRAIRSFVGANSGPSTQRTYIFYEGREDIITNLRVHSIPGGLMFFDYSPAATGMRYSNSSNTAGVIVDGSADSIAPGTLNWEMLKGNQGVLCIAHQTVTDAPDLQISSYYLDAVNPAIPQPTGDSSAYGSSGPWVVSSIPNTDPAVTPFNKLTAIQSLTFESLNSPTTQASRRSLEQKNPLVLNAVDRVAPNRAPVITSQSPELTLSLAANAIQTFQVSARDDDGDTLAYAWSVDGQARGTSAATFSWTASGTGTHSIAVTVSDGKGGSASRTWTVTVTSVNLPPQVKFLSPASGSTYTAPATISGTIQAIDPDGAITKVEIYLGSTLLKTLTQAPYSVTYTNVAAGTYTVTAKATDNNGASATSAAVTLTVKAASTVAADEPDATLLQNSPPVLESGATATPSAARIGELIAFTASASDADGDTLDYAWDFGDGTNGSGASVSHAYGAAGDYSVTLTVSDDNGASTTSTIAVAVTALTGGEPDEIEEEIKELGITMMRISLVFSRSGKDAISLKGTFALPEGLSLANQNLTVNVGGVAKTFTLSSKGKAVSGSDSIAIKVSSKNSSATISAKFSKGDYAAAFADEGLTSSEASGAPRTVRVDLTIGSNHFRRDQSQVYSSKGGKGASVGAGLK